MKPEIQRRLIRTAILSAIAAVIGIGIGYYQVQSQPAQVIKQASSTSVPGVTLDGTFSLTDQNGAAVTEKTYDGKYRIIYFGFTFCPMVCPTELQKISQVLNKLGAKGENIQPILISVDPDRDTPEVMKQYVAQFHPRLIGLTGTKEQTQEAVKHYKVFAQKAQDEAMEEYTMDHSSFIYLMSPDNRLVSIYRSEDSADFIAADIRDKISS